MCILVATYLCKLGLLAGSENITDSSSVDTCVFILLSMFMLLECNDRNTRGFGGCVRGQLTRDREVLGSIPMQDCILVSSLST
jgi:hypothetical protein